MVASIILKGPLIAVMLCGSFQEVHPQKVVEKTMIEATAANIHIDATNTFKVTLETQSSNELNVEAVLDGEYGKEQMVQITREGGTVLISAGFQPNFSAPNDKLSAHKVSSIALNIQLPKDKNVHVQGNAANIHVEGNYQLLKIVLNDGECHLFGVQGTVNVHTQSGDITVKDGPTEIDAISKYGKVSGFIDFNGKNKYQLSTVTGNIYLNRTE